MKKVIKILLIVSLLISSAFANSVRIGPFSVNLEWCKRYQNLASIMSSMTNLKLPVNGGMGMTMGFIQTDNPIVSFCDYMIGLQRLEGINAIWYTAETANRVFELKKDQELGLMRDFYDLSTTAYNFESGEFNKERVFTPQYARRLDRFYRNVADYYDENIAESSEDALNVQTRRERERDMQRLSNLAQRRQILEENISCQEVDKKRPPNYANIAREIQQKETRARELDRLAQDHERALAKMSIRISNDVNQHTEIRRDINDMIQYGLSFQTTLRTFTEDNFRRVEVDSDQSDPLAERTEVTSERVEQRYQQVNVRVDQGRLEENISKWGALWNRWVRARTSSELRFVGRKHKVEEEFKQLNTECGRATLIRSNNLDSRDPDFSYKLRRLENECVEGSRQRTADAGGLFNEHLQLLFDYRKEERETRAEIYTLESRHLGVFRSFSVTEAQDNSWEDAYSRTEVSCADTPSMALMQRQQVELERTNLAANTIIAEQLTKQTAMREAEMQRERQREQEEANRREIYRARRENTPNPRIVPEPLDF